MHVRSRTCNTQNTLNRQICQCREKALVELLPMMDCVALLTCSYPLKYPALICLFSNSPSQHQQGQGEASL